MARTYTDEQRTRAILRAEELSNIRAAAREAGVSESTLRTWMKTNPGQTAQLRAEVKTSMLNRLEDGAMRFYNAMMQALEEGQYKPGQLMTGFGIVFDKYARLKELEIDTGDDGQLNEFVNAMKEAYERDRPTEPESS